MEDFSEQPVVQVGDLAAASGVTVRALHHYEAIGLVSPSARTDAGYRLYDSAAVARLYQVIRLRDLGMPLERVGQVLDEKESAVQTALVDHVAGLDLQISRLNGLREGLTRALADQAGASSSLAHWMEVLTDMDGTNSLLRKRISILVYKDLAKAHDYLVDVFGLTPGSVERSPDGMAVHGEVLCGDGVIWLHPESDEFGLASPATVGKATATMAVIVDDVDAHHEAVKAKGGDIAYGPVDQPYGYREYSARDCEGMLWSFMKELK